MFTNDTRRTGSVRDTGVIRGDGTITEPPYNMRRTQVLAHAYPKERQVFYNYFVP